MLLLIFALLWSVGLGLLSWHWGYSMNVSIWGDVVGFIVLIRTSEEGGTEHIWMLYNKMKLWENQILNTISNRGYFIINLS